MVEEMMTGTTGQEAHATYKGSVAPIVSMAKCGESTGNIAVLATSYDKSGGDTSTVLVEGGTCGVEACVTATAADSRVGNVDAIHLNVKLKDGGDQDYGDTDVMFPTDTVMSIGGSSTDGTPRA